MKALASTVLVPKLLFGNGSPARNDASLLCLVEGATSQAGNAKQEFRGRRSQTGVWERG
jgi:hypothetical protein